MSGPRQGGYGGWDASVYGGPPSKRSSPWPWVGLGVGLLVLFLLFAVLGGALLSRDRSGDRRAPSTPSPLVDDRGPAGAPTTPPPKVAVPPSRALPSFDGEGSKVVGRIADPKAGFSYARLGRPWGPKDAVWPEFTAGQDFPLGRSRNGVDWYALVFSKPLPRELWAYCRGAGTLPELAAATAQRFADTYYTDDYERTDIGSQEIELDGHPAYVIAFELTSDPLYPGFTVTRQTSLVAVIETGKRFPGVLYAAIPATHYRLRPDMTTVLASVTVPGPKPSKGSGDHPTQGPDVPPVDGAPRDAESCVAPKPSPKAKF